MKHLGGTRIIPLFLIATLGSSVTASGRSGGLAFSAGWFGAHEQGNPVAQAEITYRRPMAGPLQGLAVAMMTSDGAVFLGAGLGVAIPLGRHLVLTPSFTPGCYSAGGGRELGFPLEFESRLELSWVFEGGSRLGLAIAHLSNGGLGSTNPGVESVAVVWAFPLPDH